MNTDTMRREAALLREYPDTRGAGSQAQYFASYIAGAATPERRATLMAEVRDALGHDAKGGAAFDQVLEQGQSPVLSVNTGIDISGRLRDAFARNVERGTISPAETRALADREAALAHPGAHEAPIGTSQPGLTERFGRLSSYVDTLGHDPRSNTAREAFVEASLDHATRLRESNAGISAQFYGQAANALADMPAADVQRHLEGLRRNDPDGVAHFAAGAIASEADRALDRNFVVAHESYRADGLAAVIDKTTAEIRRGEASGHANQSAEIVNAQLFTGTTAFLNAARGTALDRSLGDRDERTGLREALNGSMQHNFPTILRQVSDPDGQGLAVNAGFDTIASYSRFEFGAPNDAHGRQTAGHAQEIVGQLIGTLHGDLLKAGTDHGADLRRDFGAGTFGNREQEQRHAAMINGEIIGAIKNGINQDFDVRMDRHQADQAANHDAFENAANIASYAGKAIKSAAPVFEVAEGTLEALSAAVPKRETVSTGRVEQLDTLFETLKNSFAVHRPGAELGNAMHDGLNSSATAELTYRDQRLAELSNDGAKDSQKGFLSSLLLNAVTPSPLEPPSPATPQRRSEAELLGETQRAVKAYNEANPKRPLPMPAAEHNHASSPAVANWDHKTHRGGTVLQIGEGEFAYHVGQGRYQVFTAEDTHGVHPVSGQPARLGADGSVHQDVRGALAFER